LAIAREASLPPVIGPRLADTQAHAFNQSREAAMKSQSDIAKENQDGIKKANKALEKASSTTDTDRATRFDGSGDPGNAGGTFRPRDDTPFSLKKRDDSKK